MKLVSKKHFQKSFGTSLFISLWDKLETYVGHPCETGEELLSELIKILEESACDSKHIKEQDVGSKYFDGLNEIDPFAEERQLFSAKIKELTEKYDKLNEENKQLSQLSQKKDVSYARRLIDINNVIEELSFNTHLTPEMVIKNLKQQIISNLAEFDIHPLDKTGIKFDPKFHEIVSIAESDDVSLDGIIADTMSVGYEKNGDCLIPQKVIIYHNKQN